MGAETTDRQTYLSKTGIRADRRLNQTIARAAIAAAVTTGAGVIMSPCRNRAKWSRVTPVKPENAAIPSPSVDTNPKCRLPTNADDNCRSLNSRSGKPPRKQRYLRGRDTPVGNLFITTARVQPFRRAWVERNSGNIASPGRKESRLDFPKL